MEHEQNKVKVAPPSVWNYVVKFGIVFAFVALMIFAKIRAFSTLPGTASTTKLQETNSSISATDEFQSTIAPMVSNYRAILLLERAADLIVAFLEQIQAGQIALGDSATRIHYTYAFPVAIDAYNQTTPPVGLGEAWRSVSTVAIEYSKVYTLLLQGKPIASKDLFNLKAFRPILTNYQNMLELNLAHRGIGPDALDAEKRIVDRLLRENYGDLPVPTRAP